MYHHVAAYAKFSTKLDETDYGTIQDFFLYVTAAVLTKILSQIPYKPYWRQVHVLYTHSLMYVQYSCKAKG